MNNEYKSFPILKTERLVLKQLCENDKAAIFLLRSDERVNKYIDRPQQQSIDEALAFINKINMAIEQNQSVYWAISLKNNAELIGTICLWNFSANHLTAELGYELSPTFQGQGIMNEAIEAVLKYAFEIIELESIVAYTHKDNSSSIKLLEKNGFKWEVDKIDEENSSNLIYSSRYEKK